MMFKKTVGAIDAKVDQHAEDFRADLERATAVLTVTLVICAAIAGFAVLYAASREVVSDAGSA